MNKISKTISIVFTAMFILSGMAGAVPTSDEGTPSGIDLDGSAVSIDLCTKMIPTESGHGWGICVDDAVTKGTFSYEPNAANLNFNAEASGLGGLVYDYPEVSDLALAGVTQTTLRWTWTTPNREYFVKNIVTVKETMSEVVVLSEEKSPGANEHVNVLLTGLKTGTSYTITVQSVYNEPSGSEDGEYSLIYYRDTDPNNVNPSEKGYKLLDQAMSVDGVVVFSGYQFIGEDIPMSGDVNVRGKIWIVPTSELNSDGTLKWTGYGIGNTMTDYLFESDLIDGGASPADWMGGITYTYTPEV